MKKCLTILMFIIIFSCEKKSDSSLVPEVVIDSFQTRYPQATQVEWKIRHDKYAAEFQVSEKDIKADFNANGSFLGEK